MIETNLHNNSNLLINNDSISDLTTLILSNHGYSSAKINIIITDDDSLRSLTREYFDENIFTDVIAFNLEEDPFEGEIYISHHRVKDNAIFFNQTFQDEFKRVLIHGLLHLCGHLDYTASQKQNMNIIEDKFLDQFNQEVVQE